MDKVIQSFKDLYNSPDVVKRHLMLCLVIYLPALLGAYVSYVDKETPKELLIPFMIAIGVLILFSIIPFICLGGYYVRFLKNKLNSEFGIPEYSHDLIKTGFKAIPMYIVWGFYGVVISLIIVALMVAPVVAFTIGTFSLGAWGKLLLIFLYVIWFILMMAIGFVIYPFFSYAFIEYAQNTENGGVFCPMIVVEYMKKSFKETIIVALKYFVANIVINMGLVVVLIGVMALAAVSTLIIALVVTNADKIEYHPLGIFIFTLIYSIGGVTKIYASKMVLFATNSQYIEIYRKLKEKQQIGEN